MTDTLENVGTVPKSSRAGARRSYNLDLKTTKWFAESRGVSLPTLEQLPVGSETVFFPDADARQRAAIFHYSKGFKARSIEGKFHVSGGGFEREFWGLPEVLKGPLERVYIVEGEPDRVALVEAGIPANCVLAAQGAKDKPTEGDPRELQAYAYVTAALAAGLNKAKKIIWCGDDDEAGRLLRDDMVQLFGAAKFNFVDWPEGVKDANGMLLSDGPEALRELVTEGWLPWPVDGVYTLSELPEPAPMTLWNPGFDEWESKIRLAPRTLSVVTGHPGHGKTALWGQVWFNVVRRYEVPMCIATFETRPKPHFRRQLRTLFNRMRETEQDDTMRAAADKWINERYLWLVHPTGTPDLQWFLDKAEIAVIRHGCRILQVDPWNRLEAKRAPGESEPDYISRCLRTLHQFAQDLNVHVQILAHPSKMEGARRGHAPMLEDIAGAKHWDNMPDAGYCVHRPDITGDGRTKAELYCRKARFEELGYPCKLGMEYDAKKGAFKSVDYPSHV